MNQTTTGWVILIAALGMLFGLLAIDIASLKEWSEVRTPLFIGGMLGHFAVVISAFVGGKLIPSTREQAQLDKESTKPLPPV